MKTRRLSGTSMMKFGRNPCTGWEKGVLELAAGAAPCTKRTRGRRPERARAGGPGGADGTTAGAWVRGGRSAARGRARAERRRSRRLPRPRGRALRVRFCARSAHPIGASASTRARMRSARQACTSCNATPTAPLLLSSSAPFSPRPRLRCSARIDAGCEVDACARLGRQASCGQVL